MNCLTTHERPARSVARVLATILAIGLLAACADDVPVAPRSVPVTSGVLALNGRGGKPPLGKIAFSRGLSEFSQSIFVMNADGSGMQRITDGSSDESPAWSPDYKSLVFVRASITGYHELMKYTFGKGRLESLVTMGGAVQNPAWSPDGATIAFDMWEGGNRDVFVMNADGTNIQRLTTSAGEDRHPSWSPDGQRIAYESESSGNREIHVMHRSGTGHTQVTSCLALFASQCKSPAWSPVPGDERIVYATDRPDAYQIHVINADGSNRATLLTNTHTNDSRPRWSRDATHIAFESRMVGGGSDIFSMGADGSGVTQLTPASTTEHYPAWSR